MRTVDAKLLKGGLIKFWFVLAEECSFTSTILDIRPSAGWFLCSITIKWTAF